jgi:hypothetical protein
MLLLSLSGRIFPAAAAKSKPAPCVPEAWTNYSYSIRLGTAYKKVFHIYNTQKGLPCLYACS